MKKTKNSAKDWWEYTNTKCFQENARTFSKNSTTQENIKILRLEKKTMKLLPKTEIQTIN